MLEQTWEQFEESLKAANPAAYDATAEFAAASAPTYEGTAEKDVLATCSRCSAVVADRDRHTEWHRRVTLSINYQGTLILRALGALNALAAVQAAEASEAADRG